jgi:hypothetical protein
MAGLFYDHVVVGEADADRSFYQEINERLLATSDKRGAPHTLFLNAENKQTIPKIVEPLRKLGVPAATISDLDVLKEGGDQWTRHLRAANIPVSEHQPYGARRKTVLEALFSKDPDFKRKGGLDLLSGADRETASNLLGDLARYGFFIVPRGEVEAWLSTLDIPREKGGWLRAVFERMGSDPRKEDYVRPSRGDVWDFIGQVREWLTSNDRRGIPL